MTRIVAGVAKGRILKVPASGTRPTSERVREALFSRLEHRGYIDGCEVLDLFAGSGALGLEAASRGARHVELVEHAASAVTLLKRNSATVGVDGVVVAHSTVESWLALPPNRAYDLVFLDPPYDMREDHLRDVLAALPPHLADDAMVVVERASRSPEPQWPAELALEDARSWGDTRAWSALRQVPETRLDT